MTASRKWRVVLLGAPLLALGSCDLPATAPSKSSMVTKWRDPETGCVYLVYARGFSQNSVGSLSMRYRADGTPDCPGTAPTTNASAAL